ncbi:MAG: hypothetical protein K2P10_05655, partial [Oscillospiraceae bacterium]|nr:hypothetical protein [Oscillospiraceae bacterium]
FRKSYVLFLQDGFYQSPYAKSRGWKPLRRKGFQPRQKSLVADFSGLVARPQLMSTDFVIFHQFAAGSSRKSLGSQVVAFSWFVHNWVQRFEQFCRYLKVLHRKETQV